MRRGAFGALVDRLRELAKDDPATLQDLREVESMSAKWDFDGETYCVVADDPDDDEVDIEHDENDCPSAVCAELNACDCNCDCDCECECHDVDRAETRASHSGGDR